MNRAWNWVCGVTVGLGWAGTTSRQAEIESDMRCHPSREMKIPIIKVTIRTTINVFFPLLPLAAEGLFQEHSIAQISEGPVELLTRERFKRYVEIGRNLRVTYIVACQGLLT